MSAGTAMIVGVRLTHGLGNQMFQYAAGLALAQKLNRPLVCAWRISGIVAGIARWSFRHSI